MYVSVLTLSFCLFCILLAKLSKVMLLLFPHALFTLLAAILEAILSFAKNLSNKHQVGLHKNLTSLCLFCATWKMGSFDTSLNINYVMYTDIHPSFCVYLSLYL